MSNMLFSIKTENKIFNRFSPKFFVSKMVSKDFKKNFGEKKLLYMLFSIKMEIKYLIVSTEVFVSPCAYKLIVYIYIFSYLEPALHKQVVFGAGFEPAHCKHAIRSRNRSRHPTLKLGSIFFVTYEHIYSF